METFEVVDVLERNFAGALTVDDQQFIREVASLGFTRVKIQGKGWVKMLKQVITAKTQEAAILYVREKDGPAAEIISCKPLDGCWVCGGTDEHVDEGQAPK